MAGSLTGNGCSWQEILQSGRPALPVNSHVGYVAGERPGEVDGNLCSNAVDLRRQPVGGEYLAWLGVSGCIEAGGQEVGDGVAGRAGT